MINKLDKLIAIFTKKKPQMTQITKSETKEKTFLQILQKYK